MAFSAGAVAAAVFGAARGKDGGMPVVVELFTSQGCSSCLPADDFLEELSRRSGVIALSLNVDYWDYLGWRDTLGSPDCAKRQQDYARRRGDGLIYTPQMIINGQQQFVGSDRQSVLHAVAEEPSRDGAGSADILVLDGGRELMIKVTAAPSDELRQDSTVWLMTVAPRVEVEIKGGENAGRTVTYSNVVRKIIPAGMWNGDAVTLSLPKSAILTDVAPACAVLLQVDGTGPIIGAAWVSGNGT